MRRLYKAMAVAALCGLLATPTMDAQRRPSSNGGGRGAQTSQQRPAASVNNKPSKNNGMSNVAQRPNNQPPGGVRPGNSGNQPPGGVRPNNPGNQPPGGVRPGNPGNQPPGGVRPNNPGPRPNNPGPSMGYRPAPQPNRPPMGRPPVWTYNPPRPPASWRPRPGLPVFSSIFGLNFGVALNLSLNSLINSGYNVYSYGNNTVYLNNVSYFNYNWPTATLFYGVNGLTHTEMFYSTMYYDMNRYNNVYNQIVRQYGMPYSTTNNQTGISATWFAGNGNFITLSYMPEYGADGVYRYYTKLIMGI